MMNKSFLFFHLFFVKISFVLVLFPAYIERSIPMIFFLSISFWIFAYFLFSFLYVFLIYDEFFPLFLSYGISVFTYYTSFSLTLFPYFFFISLSQSLAFASCHSWFLLLFLSVSLPAYCMISEMNHFILLLYFITIWIWWRNHYVYLHCNSFSFCSDDNYFCAYFISCL